MNISKRVLFCTIIMGLFIVGCSISGGKNNIENIAIEEAQKITSREGYSLESEKFNESDILIDDERVFELIKEASIKGGYSEDDLNSMTEDRKVVSYKLKEKSKFEDMSIMLCLVIDKNKVIGAYLNYEGYYPGITSINDKVYFK